MGSDCLMGTRFSLGDDENVLKLSNGEGYTKVVVLNVTELYGLKTNRLPVISPEKLGLFNRELQFRVCKHGKSQASPPNSKRSRTQTSSASILGNLYFQVT